MSEQKEYICVSCNDEFTLEEMEDNAWQCPTCKMPITGSSSQLAHDYDELCKDLKSHVSIPLDVAYESDQTLDNAMSRLLDGIPAIWKVLQNPGPTGWPLVQVLIESGQMAEAVPQLIHRYNGE